MALPDRALPSASVALYNDSTWKDWVSGTSASTAGTAYAILDPIVSGTSGAMFIPAGTAGSDYVSVTIPSLKSFKSFTIEAYLYFDHTATGGLLKIGSSNLFGVNSAGYVTVTPPYVGATTVNIDYQAFDTTQFGISCIGGNYSVYINGVVVASGFESGDLVSGTTLVFERDTAVSKTLAAAFVFPTASKPIDITRRMLEAYAMSLDATAEFNAETAIITDSNQLYQNVYNVPANSAWTDLYSENMRNGRDGFGLNLKKFEGYYNDTCYYIDDIGDSSGPSGTLLVRIPSYATSGSTRGVLHLRADFGTKDRHTIKLSGNQLQYIKHTVTLDGLGNVSIASSTPQSIGAALTASASVIVGFVWDASGLRVVRDGAVVSMTELTNYTFSPYGLSAYVGVDDALANPYHATQGAWDWELRLWNFVDETATATDYGTHTFFMNDTSSMPVRAEGLIRIEVPLGSPTASAQETVKTPVFWYDGYSASVTSQAIV